MKMEEMQEMLCDECKAKMEEMMNEAGEMDAEMGEGEKPSPKSFEEAFESGSKRMAERMKPTQKGGLAVMIEMKRKKKGAEEAEENE